MLLLPILPDQPEARIKAVAAVVPAGSGMVGSFLVMQWF
jgi:hypothetical protein